MTKKINEFGEVFGGMIQWFWEEKHFPWTASIDRRYDRPDDLNALLESEPLHGDQSKDYDEFMLNQPRLWFLSVQTNHSGR